MGEKRRRIDSYNAFRGICAMGILFSHMSYLAEASNPFWKFVYAHFMRYGSRCSSFFFIVSGFLLAYTWRNNDFFSYIKGKLKRLYPLTFIVFLLAVICSFLLNDTVNGDMPVGSPLWILSMVLNPLLLKAFVPIKTVFYSFHGPSWYISVLFMFYVFGYFIVKKIKNNSFKEYGWIGAVTLAYVIECIICIFIDFVPNKSAFPDGKLYLTYVNPYFRIFGEGLFGVLLCKYMPKIQNKINSSVWNRSMLEIIAVIVFFAFFIMNNFFTYSIWNAWVWFIPVGMVLIAFYNDSGVVSRESKKWVWQFLGNISFEVYMTHAFVYEGLPVIAGLISGDLKNWLIFHAGIRFVITLVASVIFAWTVHLGLNKNAFNYKKF